eukprot:GHVN01001603.1.p1 GENE.GHVN01001603.1~~GHVN01001603.1.p1  ORF type:complete len:277 (-),score=18.32 GHVN01001603.1:984-1814(-)
MPLDLKAPQNDILAQMSHCLITSKISIDEWTLWSTTPFVEPFATVLGEAFTVDQSVGLLSDLVVLSFHHPLFGEDLLNKAVNKLSASQTSTILDSLRSNPQLDTNTCIRVVNVLACRLASWPLDVLPWLVDVAQRWSRATGKKDDEDAVSTEVVLGLIHRCLKEQGAQFFASLLPKICDLIESLARSLPSCTNGPRINLLRLAAEVSESSHKASDKLRTSPAFLQFVQSATSKATRTQSLPNELEEVLAAFSCLASMGGSVCTLVVHNFFKSTAGS